MSDRSNLIEARELAKQFPREVAGYTLGQIVAVWETYSATLCAQWIIPTAEKVEEIFDECARNGTANGALVVYQF